MGKDINGKYFLFYDNAVTSQDIGTSDENKLYCKLKDYRIEGAGDLRNGYIQDTADKRYIFNLF